MSTRPRSIASAILALSVMLVARPAHAITIIAPASGTTLKPGSTITVTVVPTSADEQVSTVSVGMDSSTADAIASATVPGGFDAQMTVPITAVGPDFIVAFALLANGNGALDYLAVNVDPGPLRGLIVSGPSSMGTIGQVVQLSVQGTFNDGVTRFVTLPERGTTYASNNEAVLGVHPNGLIQARTSGTALLSVTNRGQTATVVIVVSVPSPPNNTIPVADAGPDQVVPPVTVVTLSAAASSDADGDPLTYRWYQESGRIVTLQGTNGVQTSFVSPRVDAQEVLTFSLVVSDNKGASTFPVLVHVTVQP
jgi:hypothetical protein